MEVCCRRVLCVLEIAKYFSSAPKQPCNNLPPALLICVVDGALKRQKYQEKGR